MIRLSLLLLMTSSQIALADAVLAARTMRASSILTSADLTQSDADIPGSYGDAYELIGMETRVVLYAGRPILRGDVGPPAIVDRNQVVPLIYAGGGLHIVTEGRALGRGAAGEVIRIMNLSSRTTVSGTVMSDGSVRVRPQ